MTGVSGLFENTKGALARCALKTECECTCECKKEAWKERMKEEYHFVKEKYEKLRKMLIKYEADTLDFEPTCPVSLLIAQHDAMDEYLHCLEVRAEYEGVEL